MVWEICLALRGITNYHYCVSDETRYNRYTTGQDEALAGRRVNVYVQTTGTQAAVATQDLGTRAPKTRETDLYHRLTRPAVV